ncbi:hypothetical protein [Amycolatopsis circi]|nr:hypothetical protein [Amycolatopsis circi]
MSEYGRARDELSSIAHSQTRAMLEQPRKPLPEDAVSTLVRLAAHGREKW